MKATKSVHGSHALTAQVERVSAKEPSMNPFQSSLDSISLAGSRRQTGGSASGQPLQRVVCVMEPERGGVRTPASQLPISQGSAESGASAGVRYSGRSSAVAWRGLLLKVMRTIRSIQVHVDDEAAQSLAILLMQQLEEMMAELNQASAWPLPGRRPTSDEYAAAVEDQLSDNIFDHYMDR